MVVAGGVAGGGRARAGEPARPVRCRWGVTLVRRLAATVFALSTGGCATEPAPKPALPVAPPVVASAPPKPVEAPAPPAPPAWESAYPRVRPPDTAPACAFSTVAWRPRRSIALRAATDAEAFGFMGSGDASVRLSIWQVDAGAGARVFAELSTDDVRVAGYVAPGELELHAAEPVALAGVFLPSSNTTIRLAGPAKAPHDPALAGAAEPSTGGQLEVALELPDDLKLLPGAPEPRGPLRCDALNLGGARFQPDTLLPRSRSMVTLPATRLTQLWTGPEGKPLMQFPTERAGGVATEVERVGRWTKLAVRVDDVVVLGWARSDALRSMNGGRGSISGSGRSTRGSARRPSLRTIACGPELPLLVAHADGWVRVGAIKSQVPVDVLEEGGVETPIQLRQKGLATAGKLAVPTAALVDCRIVPPK